MGLSEVHILVAVFEGIELAAWFSDLFIATRVLTPDHGNIRRAAGEMAATSWDRQLRIGAKLVVFGDPRR